MPQKSFLRLPDSPTFQPLSRFFFYSQSGNVRRVHLQALHIQCPPFSKSHDFNKIATMTNDQPHGNDSGKNKAVFDQLKRRDFLSMVGGSSALMAVQGAVNRRRGG